MRWTSARTIKETFVPATEHAYPHMAVGLMAGLFAKTAPAGDPGRRTVRRTAAGRRTDAGHPRGGAPVRAGGDVGSAYWIALPLLRDSGRYVSVDYLGEDVTEVDDADAAVRAYLELIDALGR